MITDRVLVSRARKGLEEVAGIKFAALYMLRMFDDGPQPPERLVECLNAETKRVLKIRGVR